MNRHKLLHALTDVQFYLFCLKGLLGWVELVYDVALYEIIFQCLDEIINK